MIVLGVELACGGSCVQALVNTGNVEEVAEEGAEDDEVSARYADADFEIGPDPSLDLSDCGSCYSLFGLARK